jgi:hypothetical protein
MSAYATTKDLSERALSLYQQLDGLSWNHKQDVVAILTAFVQLEARREIAEPSK